MAPASPINEAPAQQTSAPAAPTTNQQQENQPAVGREVLVSYFDGSHTIRNVVAHVLAIGPADPGEMPVLTVAFPSTPADGRKLGSPRWSDGYERRAGVVHHADPAAVAGKASVVWGHAAGDNLFPGLIKPEGTGVNPIFERQALEERGLKADVAQVSAKQRGKAPEGVSAPVLTSEVGSPINTGAGQQAAAEAPQDHPQAASGSTQGDGTAK